MMQDNSKTMRAPVSGATQLPGQASHPEEGRAWWKYPVVWMVVGGPLAVIIACIITWFFIMRSPNEVLIESKETENPALSQEGAHYTPANRARNHAATGGVPASN